LHDSASLARFEQAVLPHLGAAYNLARWLTGNDHDAEDVVQEAYLRACQFFGGFRGGDGRAWLLRIVRNTCFTWLARNRPPGPTTPFDEDRHSEGIAAAPDAPLIRQEDRARLGEALERLPEESREVIVLRELEGLSYKEIAGITGAPMGTVMSRLARARERLQACLSGRAKKGS
jgi:RNA polymerase sigma-70 factor (ECF subfamily)